MDQYYSNMIRDYLDNREALEFPDNARIDLFKSLAPLTRDLMITTYGSFKDYVAGQVNPHPFEEYYLSFDENMFENELVASIARRMGIYIDVRTDAYKVFIDRVIEVIQKSGFSYEELNKYINMTRNEYHKYELDHHYDDRLFAFMKR